MQNTVLVTGGAGYVGSHTCKALSEAGLTPIVFDNLSTGHARAVKWGPLVVGDLRDTDFLLAALRRYSPAAVFHFAASAYVGESFVNPFKYYQNNVGGTLSLVSAMSQAGCRRLVFSSSCATYGAPKALPITEDTPQFPINPYGRSKLMVEQILQDCAVTCMMGVVALRYFNAAGADPNGDIGEDHSPETHLIPLALAAAAGGEPLTVLGNDYPTIDGTCIRDFVHVSDLADAHVRAMSLTDEAGFVAFNLGSGRGFSVRELLTHVESVTGKMVAHHIGPRRTGDPPELVASAEKANHLLGWNPQYSDLDVIVDTAWKWRQKQ